MIDIIRNMFSAIFLTLLTWLLSIVAFVMLGVTTITNAVRSAALRLLPPPPSHERAPENDPSAGLFLFVFYYYHFCYFLCFWTDVERRVVDVY